MSSVNALNALGVLGETTTASGAGPTAADAPAKTTAPAVTAEAPASAAKAIRALVPMLGLPGERRTQGRRQPAARYASASHWTPYA